jgi:predicted nucleic acid-binding Zn ribbon protein
MSTTILRLGLWILILVLALYVLATTYENQAWTEMIPMPMLQQALTVAGALIVIGLIARVLDKGTRVVAKNRCRVCRTAIPAGAIYCREHLRSILHEEQDRIHMTRMRK